MTRHLVFNYFLILTCLGVISVDVDPEKNLVSITGIVVHIQLIMKMKKMGKKAELVEREDNDYNDFGQQVQSHAPQNLIQAEYNEYMASPGEFLEDIWGGGDDKVPPCYGPRMMMHAGYVGDMPRPPPSYDHYYGPRLMPTRRIS